MALNKITNDRFVELAVEEGVPLPLATAFYGVESDYGRNSAAFLSPQQRAGNGGMNSNPDKIGFGSMQITRNTFNGVMPGQDFYNADDETLTRAGLRYLKKAVNADGSYDLQRAKNLYFGTKADASFSVDSKTGKILPGGQGDSPYIPSQHSGVAKKVSDIEANVRNNLETGGTLLALATNNKERSDSGTSASDIVARSLQGQAAQLAPFDAAAAAAKRDQAAEVKKNELLANERLIREGQQKVLEAFGANPYGTFSAIEQTGRTLQAAQMKLMALGDNLNYRGDADPNQVGVLKAGLVNFASKYAFKPQQEMVASLAKAASDYNAVIRGAQQNVSEAFTPTSTLIAIDQASRAAGNDAIGIDLKEQQFNNAASRLEMSRMNYELGVTRQQGIEQQREFNNILARNADARAEERLTLAKAQAEQRAADLYDTTDINALNKAAEAYVKTINPSAQYTPIKDVDTFMKVFKDKDMMNGIRSQMSSGASNLVNYDVADNARKIAWSTTDSSEAARNDKIAAMFTAKKTALLDSKASNLNRGKNTTWQQFVQRTPMDKKELQAIETSATREARDRLATEPTPDTGFAKNPMNLYSMSVYIKSAGGRGLVDLLTAIGKKPDDIVSDANLVSTLVDSQLSGNMPVSNVDMLTVLHSYYQDMASMRANDKTIKDLNIPLNPNTYFVTAINNKKYNLADKAQMQSYVEYVKGNIKGFVSMNRDAVGDSLEVSSPASFFTRFFGGQPKQ